MHYYKIVVILGAEDERNRGLGRVRTLRGETKEDILRKLAIALDDFEALLRPPLRVFRITKRH